LKYINGTAPIGKKRYTYLMIALGIFVLTVLALVAFASEAQAGSRATDRTVRGDWGFSARGTIVDPETFAQVPAAAVGIFTFDGAGGCTITDQINIGGQAIPPSGFRTSTACSYNVNPDGTGTLVAEFTGDPGPTPLSFVIVDNKKELQFIRTDAGVAQGVARRQGARGEDN
jgi:hypothetical protein